MQNAWPRGSGQRSVSLCGMTHPLAVDASNAHFAVLGVMLASSVLSLLAAVFIFSVESTKREARS